MQDYETKYTILNARALTVKRWLEENFPEDPAYPEAIISSIYFDTLGLKYLHEKQASDHIKSKFRIRWYEDTIHRKPTDVCFLEFKHKVGEHRFKRRIKLPNTFHDLSLESSQFNAVMDQLRVHEGKVLEHVFPSYIVSYTRKRFVIPNTQMRLCIDFNINTPKVNLRLMHRLPQAKYLENCVFEVKGPSAILPKECRFLETLGLRKDAFSKYERCYYELIS